MKSAVETLSPTRAKLTVEVPFEELKPSLDAAYQQIAKQINVPGFRRGKVPPAVIDRQIGKGAILEQAINDALPQKYREALEANSLEPLAQPEIEVTKLDENEGFEFTAEVDVKPEFEVPSYDGVAASVDDAVVSDADIEEQLGAMRERFGTLSDVERPAADGDFVVIDLTATQDGEVVDGAELTRHELPRRSRRHDRRPRRGAGRHGRRRRHDVHHPARGWRPGGPGRPGRGLRHPGPGAGAPRDRRRLRPGRLGVRHRSTS